MKAIHQFVAGFTNGDAISNEALVMRNLFRAWGYKSDIFSEQKRILPELRKEAFDCADYASMATPDDIVILHLSIGSQVNDIFQSLPCKKVILYHNITPAEYLNLINKEMANSLALGRNQIKMLSNTADINMADSKFNASELNDLGYKEVKVLPLVLDLNKLTSSADKAVIRKFGDGTVNILFVGRCVPNKKLEDAITAFYYFTKFVEPNSRFIHVGSFAGTERYYHLLLTQIKELGLNNVHFARSVPQPQLNAFYKTASMFLCMSEHEGFCIPVIESMLHSVPVMAFAAAAVPETMDNAGVLFLKKDYKMIAEMMGQLVHNTELRSAIIKGQLDRVKRYKQLSIEDKLQNYLEPLLNK